MLTAETNNDSQKLKIKGVWLAGQKNNSIYLEMKALTDAAAAAVLDSSKEISLSSNIKLSIEKHLEIN